MSLFIATQHAMHTERDIFTNYVCPSVCPSTADIESKQMHISLYFDVLVSK